MMQPCPERRQLEQLLAQHISDAERTALERRVEECGACQQALEELTRVHLWLQVATGAELDRGGSLHIRDAATWQERRQRLDQLGGWPQR
jgi:hypothetical protein